MSRVLVTGATGFIGAHVAADLARSGYGVVGLVRPGREWALPAGCAPATGDVLDPGSLRRAIVGCDAVVHVAALYSLAAHRSRDVRRTNVLGTLNVIEAARDADVRLVHTSSVATIGLPPDGPGTEDTPRTGRPVGAYKRSKIEAEELVLLAARAGLWATIVNPSAPVGPGDWRPTPTGRMVRDALRGRMAAYVDTGLNIVDVRDVAAGHRLALERGTPGRRYILGSTDGNMTLETILREISALLGRRPPRVRIPLPVAIGAAAIDEIVEGTLLRREPAAPLAGARMARARMFFDPSRAVRELGLPQSDPRRALVEAVRWYQAHPGGIAGTVAAA